MLTTKSRQRSAKCNQCGTVSIFSRRSNRTRSGDNIDNWTCPVCKHELGVAGSIAEKKASDVDRIDEFFSRFC